VSLPDRASVCVDNVAPKPYALSGLLSHNRCNTAMIRPPGSRNAVTADGLVTAMSRPIGALRAGYGGRRLGLGFALAPIMILTASAAPGGAYSRARNQATNQSFRQSRRPEPRRCVPIRDKRRVA